MPNTTQYKPRYRRQSGVKIQLQKRDTGIIYQVYKHRLLNSAHILALFPSSYRGVLRRLSLLYHTGYLDRPPEQRKPYKKGGTDPIIYGLGNKGADLLLDEFNIPRSKVDWTSKNRELKYKSIEHTLMESNFMVCLELAVRQAKNIELITPGQILANMLKKNKGKPLGWEVRVRREFKGTQRNFNLSVIPDKAFGLYFPQNPAGRKRAFFMLEADRSTMPIKSNNLYRSSYFKKIICYWESWKQDLYPKTFGFKAARVLTITRSQERINNMMKACREVDVRGKGSKMFLFAQAKEFNPENPAHIFNNIWQNSRDTEIISINDAR